MQFLLISSIFLVRNFSVLSDLSNFWKSIFILPSKFATNFRRELFESWNFSVCIMSFSVFENGHPRFLDKFLSIYFFSILLFFRNFLFYLFFGTVVSYSWRFAILWIFFSISEFFSILRYPNYLFIMFSTNKTHMYIKKE